MAPGQYSIGGGAGKVDRKMKGRLQSGGAVLWFLRKHAPMPTPFSNLTPLLGDSETVEQQTAEVPQRPATSCGVVVDRPQRRFLNDTVRAIRTELDEMHPASADIARVRGGNTNAFHHREKLRQAFADHSEVECERLRSEVAAREAEVRDLLLKSQQMERWVQATKTATQKRIARARTGQVGGSDGHKRKGSLGNGDKSGAKSLLAKSHSKQMNEVAEKDKNEEGEESKETTVVKRAEEWQQVIARGSEVVKGLGAKIDEQKEALQRVTVKRKAMETSLFISSTELLRLRACTQKSEQRAHQLANELKKVYQELPVTIDRMLAQVSATTNLEVKAKELTKLQEENREEHFKFLNGAQLTVESEAFDQRIEELSDFVSRSRDLLNSDRDMAVALEKRAVEMRESMAFLQRLWSKLVKRALELQVMNATSGNDGEEGPELLLFRAGAGVDAVQELLAQEGRLPPSEG